MNHTKYNKLIIQVSLQNFTFCVKNQLSSEIIHFKSLPIHTIGSLENQLETIFHQHELLQVSYDDVLVLHDNNLNTFVPNSFFDERALGSYLQYNTKVFATDYFSYDDLDFQEMKNVYVPYVAFNNFFIDQFGAFTYKHLHTNLVEFVLNKTKAVTETEIYAYVNKDHFELIVSKNGKLILFNSFEIQSAEDFIYYVLFTYEQLKLNTEKVPIYLFGSIEKGDTNYDTIYKYIRNIYLVETEIQNNTSNIDKKQLENHYILIHS